MQMCYEMNFFFEFLDKYCFLVCFLNEGFYYVKERGGMQKQGMV